MYFYRSFTLEYDCIYIENMSLQIHFAVEINMIWGYVSVYIGNIFLIILRLTVSSFFLDEKYFLS